MTMNDLEELQQQQKISLIKSVMKESENNKTLAAKGLGNEANHIFLDFR